jgi:hypothetical protein
VHDRFDANDGFKTETSVKIEERKNNALAAIFEVRFYQNEICKAECRSVNIWLNRTKPSSNEKKTTEEKKNYTYRSAVWSLPDFLGRQYAKVSGDYNPIHLHPILAQAFGFRGTVLHGWCSASKVAAFIEKETGKTIKLFEVKFIKPVILPRAVVCQYSFTTENEVEFCLCSDDEEVVYLVGHTSFT